MAATPTLESTGSSMDNIGMSSGEPVQQLMATLELQYFKAVSLYRRRNYEKCVEVCNAMLQAGQENNVQMFTVPPASDVHGDDDGDDDNVANVDNNFGATNTTYAIYNNNNNIKNIKSNSVSYRSNMGNMGRNGSNLQRIAPRHNVGPWQKFDNGIGIQDIFFETTRTTATTTNNINTGGSNYNKEKIYNSKQKLVMPTWMMEGVWQLKMRALMQRVYIDDLETNDIANDGKKKKKK